MLPARYDPFGFSGIFSLRRDIDRLFRDFMRDFETPTEGEELGGGANMLSPRLDVVEQNDRFILTAEMPGVDPKDLKVEVTGSTLSIQGEKREKRRDGEERQWRYQRTLTLPETIDAGKIQANLRNGILELSLPRSEAARPKQIQVKVEGGPKQIEAQQKPVEGQKKKEAA
jgi:HSP20 family protein